jgi:hypothetical protein
MIRLRIGLIRHLGVKPNRNEWMKLMNTNVVHLNTPSHDQDDHRPGHEPGERSGSAPASAVGGVQASDMSLRPPARSEAPADQKGPRIAILVGTMTGGQGKTLVSSSIVVGLDSGDGNRSYHILGMDNVDETSMNGAAKSKIEQSIGDDLDPFHSISTLSIVPSKRNLRDAIYDPQAVSGHIDVLADRITKKDMIVDMGANLVDRFLEYLGNTDPKAMYLDAGTVRMTFVIPVTFEDTSMQNACRTLDLIHALKHEVKVCIVLNEISGAFVPGSKNINIVTLMDKARRAKALIVHMPLCRAIGLKHYTARGGGLSGKDITDARVYKREVGFESVLKASMDLQNLSDWFLTQGVRGKNIRLFAEDRPMVMEVSDPDDAPNPSYVMA